MLLMMRRVAAAIVGIAGGSVPDSAMLFEDGEPMQFEDGSYIEME